jgi:WD40 repeat protein
MSQRGHALAVARTAQAQRLGALALGEPALDRALLLAAEGVALDDTATTRSQLLAALQRSPAAIWTLRHGTAWSAGDISPDGRTLVLGDESGRLVFLDPRTRRASEPITVSSDIPFLSVRFSPDGTRVAAATSALVMLIDARTRRVLKDWPGGSAVLNVAFSADSRTLLASTAALSAANGVVEPGDVTQEIIRWDRDGRPLDDYPRELRKRGAVVAGYDHSGNLVSVTMPPGRGTTILDPQTFAVLRRYPQGGWPASLSPDGRTLAFAADEGPVSLLDLGQGAVQTLGSHRGTVTTLHFAARDLLASGGDDGQTIVWNVRRGTPIRAASGHAGAVGTALVSADASTLYSAGRDGALIEWDLTGQRGLTRALGAVAEPPLDAAADGSAFTVGSYARGYTVYDGRTLEVTRRRVLEGKEGGWDTALSGRTLATSTLQGPVVVADTRSGRRFNLPVAHSIYQLALDAQERWIALLDTEGSSLRLVDRRGATRTASSVAVGAGQDSPSPVFDPAGRWLAVIVGTTHTELQLRSLPRLELLRSVRVARGSALAVSADGGTLAVGDQSGRTSLYDSATLKRAGPALERREGGGPIHSLSFGADGKALVTTSERGPAGLWDLTSSPPTSTALDVEGRVVDAAFVGDRWTLVTIDESRGVRAWDLHPRTLLRRACAIAGRSLTRDEWREVLPDRPYAPVC